MSNSINQSVESGQSKDAFQTRYEDHSAHKDAIADFLVKFIVKEGQSLYLDAGSTVARLMERLLDNLESRKGLKILTNNMSVFDKCQTKLALLQTCNVRLYLAGGEYDANDRALNGTEAVASLRKWSPDVTIIGTSGVKLCGAGDEEHGGIYHDGGMAENEIKAQLLRHPTNHRILVFPYHRLGRLDQYQAGTFSDLWQGTDHLTLLTTFPDPETPLPKFHTQCPQDPYKELMTLSPESRFYSELELVEEVLAKAPARQRVDFAALDVCSNNEHLKVFKSSMYPRNVLVYTDRVGSVKQNWDSESNRVFNNACSTIIKRKNGTEKCRTGDGMVSAFETVDEAIEAAKALHDEAHRRGTKLRIGIHYGDEDFRKLRSLSGDDQYPELGRAAHLQKLCEDDGILVSAEAKDHSNMRTPRSETAKGLNEERWHFLNGPEAETYYVERHFLDRLASQ